MGYGPFGPYNSPGIYNTQEAAAEIARNDLVLVGTAEVILAQYRNTKDRKLIVVRNTSTGAASIITVNLGISPTATTGIQLRQNESFVDANDAGYQCFQGTITALCADANGQVTILER